MAIKLVTVTTERELIQTYDKLYAKSKEYHEEGKQPVFRDLLEIIISEPNIRRAIKKVKSNRGVRTVGVDDLSIDECLQKPEEELFEEIRGIVINYKPKMVKRVYILKSNGKSRPLGIPTIVDRIIQEMVRAVLEPIFEAQFFKHSYGFRPDRDAGMAVQRIQYVTTRTAYKWIVEGDIKGFFDNVNHTKLIKLMWSRGIKDKRVLMIIKQMLKAGVMNERARNELGTPQGGIISPLLANIYLDSFDRWIRNQWEEKTTRHTYRNRSKTTEMLKRNSKLKPAYLVRYADDWVIITNSKENALFWKEKAKRWLQQNLKLELSEEKTKITNMSKKYIEFVGFEMKLVKTPNGFIGYKSRTLPDRKRLKRKIEELDKYIRFIIGMGKTDEDLIDAINRINSRIRGIIQYYQNANQVNPVLAKYARKIRWTVYRLLCNKVNKDNVKLIPAKQVDNLTGIHGNYTLRISTIIYDNLKIGVTDLAFARWKEVRQKNPKETIYSAEGRDLLEKRKKKPAKVRADELLTLTMSERIALGLTSPIYNFEYYLNRAYAFNRDKGKCRICGKEIESKYTLNTHHISPKLPLNLVNKTINLASMHKSCHKDLHSLKPLEEFSPKIAKKIENFRKKLDLT